MRFLVTHIVKYHDMDRVTLIEEARLIPEKLLTLLHSVERDRFVSHLYQSRRNTDGRAKLPESAASKLSGRREHRL